MTVEATRPAVPGPRMPDRPLSAVDFSPVAGSGQLPDRRSADRSRARHRKPGPPDVVPWPEGLDYLK